VKTIRSSPVTRTTVWLLTLALILPLLMLGHGQATAQATAPLTVIVADFVDAKANATNTPLAIAGRDAVYNELVASGQGRFNPIPEKEVTTEAKTLGLKVPARPGDPANFSDADLTRLAKALNADAIVKGTVNAVIPKGQNPILVLDTIITDATTGDSINGGQSRIVAKVQPGQSLTAQETVDKAVSDAALAVTRQMVSRQMVTATVLNINQDVVLINRGTRDGLKAGDDLDIIRDRAGQKVSVGKIRIARAYATDSEADVLQNVGGIQPEDLARVIYRPEFLFSTANVAKANVRNTRVNFSAIGRTLTALGLGVLIAVAVKGGQATTTNVVSEPTEDGTTPEVRVTWGNNIFGQAGVVEYHIYRTGNTTPNFAPGTPYSTSGSSSSSTTSSSSSTTVDAISGIPIGTSTPTIQKYVDQPSPYYPYALIGGFVFAGSNGSNSSNSTGSSSSSSSSTTTQTCGIYAVGELDTGFTAGHTYQYYVTAIIQREVPLTSAGSTSSTGTSSSSGTSSTGTTSTGTTSSSSSSSGSSSSSSSNGLTCFESDPVAGGFATPVVPVVPTSPANQTTIDITTFNPTWPSTNGADVFQVEVSTNRTFSTAKTLYYQDVFSSAPSQSGVQQSLPSAVNLTQAAQLLADPTFNAYVNPKSGTTSTTPTLFYRVGARHDSDTPGPIDWITQSPSAANRTYRWVYGPIYQFQPTPTPPSPPSKATTTLAKAAATQKGTTKAAVKTAAATRAVIVPKVVIVPKAGRPSTIDVLLGRTERH
jgi:hypothetical protein